MGKILDEWFKLCLSDYPIYLFGFFTIGVNIIFTYRYGIWNMNYFSYLIALGILFQRYTLKKYRRDITKRLTSPKA